MKHLGIKDINTFSLVHKQSEYDESKYSDLIAKNNSTNHYRINISKSEVLYSIKEAVSKYDSPSVDGINSYIVSKKLKIQVYVLLYLVWVEMKFLLDIHNFIIGI